MFSTRSSLNSVISLPSDKKVHKNCYSSYVKNRVVCVQFKFSVFFKEVGNINKLYNLLLKLDHISCDTEQSIDSSQQLAVR